jgi:hypothetical protein
LFKASQDDLNIPSNEDAWIPISLIQKKFNVNKNFSTYLNKERNDIISIKLESRENKGNLFALMIQHGVILRNTRRCILYRVRDIQKIINDFHVDEKT